MYDDVWQAGDYDLGPSRRVEYMGIKSEWHRICV